jgi:phosphoribosylformylglycinamidine synthase
MAARADTGIEIDLSLVPQRETGMTAYEMLLSESQERMLIVRTKDASKRSSRSSQVGPRCGVIGHVRDDGRMRVMHEGEVRLRRAGESVDDEAPIYERADARSSSSSSLSFEFGNERDDGSQSRTNSREQTRNSKLETRN